MINDSEKNFTFFNLKNSNLNCLKLSTEHSTLASLIEDFERKILLLDKNISWGGTHDELKFLIQEIPLCETKEKFYLLASFKNYNPYLFSNFNNLNYSEICIFLICCYLRQSICTSIIKKRNFLKYYEWTLVVSSILKSNSVISNSILLFLTKLNILSVMCEISNQTKKEILTAILLHFNYNNAFNSLNRQGLENLLTILKIEPETKQILINKTFDKKSVEELLGFLKTNPIL